MSRKEEEIRTIMKSVSQHRRDYRMTPKELEDLMEATHEAKSREHAQVRCTKVWQHLGKKYGFYYQSVYKPIVNTTDPAVFSAIPFKAKKK